MVDHNPFDIEQAWEEVTVTSNKGDVAHYRPNTLTKQVFMKTKVGDGNQSDWRGCNVNADAIKSRPHKLVTNQDAPGSTAPESPKPPKALAKAHAQPAPVAQLPVAQPAAPIPFAIPPQASLPTLPGLPHPPTPAALPEPTGNGHHQLPKPMDLESVAPFAPGRKKRGQ